MSSLTSKCLKPLGQAILNLQSSIYHIHCRSPHTALCSSARNHIQPGFAQQQNSTRTIYTSPALNYPTKKRRKRYPFFWLQDKYRAYFDENLTPDNEKFFKQFLDSKFKIQDGASPLKTEPWSTTEAFTEGTHRVGLIGKKLGVTTLWSKEGHRHKVSVLQICDNHVIKYHSPEEFQKIGRPIDRRRHEGFGCMIVGADSRDPRKYTAEYNGLFEESTVIPKEKLSRFFVTHDARLEPGTPLFASHFKPGMHVDVYGKSQEWGITTLRFRYRLRLGHATHGVTKAHNRIGSIGRGRQWCGPLKGSKMPGHYGGERRISPSLKVARINHKYNLLYLIGTVPGDPGQYLNIYDSALFEKKPSVENPPPFPTTSAEEHASLPEEVWYDKISKPGDPSIIFEVTEEERRAAALAARKIGKAKTAQKR